MNCYILSHKINILGFFGTEKIQELKFKKNTEWAQYKKLEENKEMSDLKIMNNIIETKEQILKIDIKKITEPQGLVGQYQMV